MSTPIEQNTTSLQSILDAVNALPEAGAADPVLQSKQVSPSTSAQVIAPDSGYDGLSSVTIEAMPAATQATPSISVSSGGLITASATQSAGYVSAGTKSATKQMNVKGAQIITPGVSNQYLYSGTYLTGQQTIKGDANLVAENIKEGVSIFGVTGTHAGGGASIETCTVNIESSCIIKDVYYASLVDGEITPSAMQHVFSTSTVLENAVRGCIFAIHINTGGIDAPLLTLTNANSIAASYSDMDCFHVYYCVVETI